MNGIIFSASENYLTGINDWGNQDESCRALESMPVPPPESAPISHFNDFQTLPLTAKDKEDEEVWKDDDEEDEEEWDDEDDDWDDEDEDDDWDDEDDEDEDWDDEDEDWDDEEDDDEDEE